MKLKVAYRAVNAMKRRDILCETLFWCYKEDEIGVAMEHTKYRQHNRSMNIDWNPLELKIYFFSEGQGAEPGRHRPNVHQY